MTRSLRLRAVGLLVLTLLAGCRGLEPRWLIDRFPGTYPDVVYYFPIQSKLLSLTIDDGPDPETTPAILEVLAEHEARATFFLVSDRMRDHPELVQAILDGGHELGNHMLRDQMSAGLRPKVFQRNLREAHQLLESYGGSPWFRPGSGLYTEGMLEALEPYEYRIALASSLPIDPRLGWPPLMSTYLKASVQPGSIIVLHSVGKRGHRTVQTLNRALPNLKRRGFEFETLSQVAAVADAVEAARGLNGEPRQRLSVPVPKQLPLCLALRGNGYKVPVTIAAMARLAETLGPADAVLGTSSGGIAALLHENLRANPALNRCGNRPCSREVLGQRIALALKSVLGFSEFLWTSPAGQQVAAIASAREKGGIGPAAVVNVLRDPALRGLLRGRTLLPGAAPLWPGHWNEHRQRLVRAAASLNFGGSIDFELALRDGLLDLNFLVRQLGRVADFYAGSGPAQNDRWLQFFNQCAANQKGKNWATISSQKAERFGTCGDLFAGMVERFQQDAYPRERRWQFRGGRRYAKFERDIAPRSLSRPVGNLFPTMTTVAFVEGQDKVAAFENSKARYRRFKSVDLSPRPWFDALRVAYAGPDALTKRVVANPTGFTDLKSQRALAAGPALWRDILPRSIGEPGLAAAEPWQTPAGPRGVTFGGWLDNFGVQPLRNAGCEKVVFVTREGTDANYATAVARLIGADDRDVEALFSPAPPGSVGTALENADGVYCTDWDRFPGPVNDLAALFEHGYESPLISQDADIAQSMAGFHTVREAGPPGCTAMAREKP